MLPGDVIRAGAESVGTRPAGPGIPARPDWSLATSVARRSFGLRLENEGSRDPIPPSPRETGGADTSADLGTDRARGAIARDWWRTRTDTVGQKMKLSVDGRPRAGPWRRSRSRDPARPGRSAWFLSVLDLRDPKEGPGPGRGAIGHPAVGRTCLKWVRINEPPLQKDVPVGGEYLVALKRALWPCAGRSHDRGNYLGGSATVCSRVRADPISRLASTPAAMKR